jgi:DNA-binding response OmpR family regulator/DNA-directed RNA polymerase subunit RPC12/RpoP
MNRVLMMSNDPVLRKKSMVVLAGSGYQASEVAAGLEGLLMVDKNSFEVIIIDEELSDIDGYQACQKIRQYSDIPIILLGSEQPEHVRARVEELGFDVYVKKPVSPGELIDNVRSLLEKAGPKGNIKPKGKDKKTESTTARSSIKERNSDKPDAMPVQDWVTEMQTLEPFKFESRKAPITPLEETGPVLLESTAKESAGATLTPKVGTTKYEIWRDGRVVKLLEALLTGKLAEINPAVNLLAKGGFAFPDADRIMEITGEQTRNVLDALTMELILERKPFERLNVDPDESLQLVPVERCPRCGSGNLSRGQLIEHFFCGNVGLDQDFKNEYKYICPKCNRELKLLGTDYRNAGLQYRCVDCSEIFPAPVLKWRNLQTGKLWAPEDLTTIQLYSYRLLEGKREWLEFELKPKTQLVELLKAQGFHVDEAAQVNGSSGAVHTIDILATKDDRLAKLLVGIGILTSRQGETEVGLEELFKFDTKAYDTGLNYKVVIVIPKLSQEAMKFAERQKIGVFEARDPGTLISFLEGKSRLAAPPLTKEKAAGPQAGPQLKLVTFLKSRGYNVVEHARVAGKSGAEHMFDIFAQRDDILVKPAVAIAIAHSGNRQEVSIDKVSQFDAEAFDAGIRNKIFVAVPQLSSQGKQFAKQQKIKVLEEAELDELLRTMSEE